MRPQRFVIMFMGWLLYGGLVLISMQALAAPVGEADVFNNENDFKDFRGQTVGIQGGQQASPSLNREQGMQSLGGQTVGVGEVTVPPPQRKPRQTQSDLALGGRETFRSGGRLRGRKYPYKTHKGRRWDGCSKTAAVTGGFSSNDRRRCARSRRTIINEDFARHMNQSFMSCVRGAAKAAGLPRPQRVHINLGSLRDNRPRNGTRSKKLSQHAYGRALDIFAFNLYDSKGKRTPISAHKRNYKYKRTRNFYNSFVVCWKKSVKRKCGGRPVGAIIHKTADRALTKKGHSFYSNAAHADHIHIEFPNNCKGR